jgi:hypothetical protein
MAKRAMPASGARGLIHEPPHTRLSRSNGYRLLGMYDESINILEDIPPSPLTLAQGGAWIGGLQNPVEIVRGLAEVSC